MFPFSHLQVCATPRSSSVLDFDAEDNPDLEGSTASKKSESGEEIV